MMTWKRSSEIEDAMQSERRQWIDQERKSNPFFAPDLDSWKELLTPDQLSENDRMESLMAKEAVLDSKHRPQRLTTSEHEELHILLRRWFLHRQKRTIP